MAKEASTTPDVGPTATLPVTNEQTSAPDPDSTFRPASVPPARFLLLAVGIAIGLFLSIVDSSIVATSLYDIGVEFESLGSVNWVALAYSLGYLGFAVPFARLSDVVGRQYAFIGASITFMAFSLGCGFSQSMSQLIAFRALQGIGGSGLYSLSMIILPELCPDGYFEAISAAIGLVIASSGVLGPVLGGALTQYATWRWVFWINGPIGFVCIAIVMVTWPTRDQLPTIERRRWQDFDAFGTFLVIMAAVLVVFSFQNAGEDSSMAWDKAIFLAPLCIGIAGWVALFLWEYMLDGYFENHITPVLPFGLFRNRVYTASALSTLFIGFPYLLLIYSFPLRAQVVSGADALKSGIRLMPMLATVAVATVVAGKLNSVKNYLFETLLAGACFMTLGCGLLTLVHDTDDDSKALGFLTFAGLGFGLSTPAATMYVSIEAPVRDYAPAQGIVSQLRIFGGSLGVAMSTALVNREINANLGGVVSTDDLSAVGSGGSDLTQQQGEAIRRAYSNAFHNGMVAASAISALAILAAGGAYWPGERLLIKDQRARLIEAEMERRTKAVQERNQTNEDAEKS